MRSKLAKIATGKAGEIYRALLDGVTYGKPHRFIGDTYRRYLDVHGNKQSNANGKVFEFLVCETLAQAGIVPFYYQASFERVPNASFDLVLYDTHRPIVLTMKASPGKHYRRAGLDGLALQQVYRRALSYLVTLSASKARHIQTEIDNDDIAGLDRCILADEPEYSQMLAELVNLNFQRAEPVMPLCGVAHPAKT